MTGKDLKIVFMGTPEFAVASLKKLVENEYRVVGVITAPDKPAGRGMKMQEPDVKKYAAKVGIPVLQPEKLRNPEFIRELEDFGADLQVVVAFRMLPEVVWRMPRLGTFNLHGSLLPQYRGAAPLNRAIINGEKETGVTTFLLDHEVDTGRILFSEKTDIGDHDTVGDLHDRLMEIGAGLVLKTVDAIAEGSYTTRSQDEILTGPLKYAPKLFKEDCQIDWNKSGEQVRNLIRGLSPYPGAWTELSDSAGQISTLKIYFARFSPAPGVVPGTIFTDGKEILKIAAADGWLELTDLQSSGKRRMKTGEFLRGFHGIFEMRVVDSES
ncbi:MAG: methionyl-tRNA formyltransferase [Mangrovibacterium sp.]|nr:methionyl-tRNA formyltransferase [Mangrovibacterium sp.]